MPRRLILLLVDLTAIGGPPQTNSSLKSRCRE
jgi:hypothetical protein